MERAYCWRCKNFIVVINEVDEIEFEQLYLTCIERAKQYREHNRIGLSDTPVRELFTPVYRFYEDRGGDSTVGHVEFAKHAERNFGPHVLPAIKISGLKPRPFAQSAVIDLELIESMRNERAKLRSESARPWAHKIQVR